LNDSSPPQITDGAAYQEVKVQNYQEEDFVDIPVHPMSAIGANIGAQNYRFVDTLKSTHSIRKESVDTDFQL
jgi:hypothetical protein